MRGQQGGIAAVPFGDATGILVVEESDHIILANKQFGLQFEIPDALLSTRDDQIVLNHVLAKIEGPDVFAERVKYLYSHRNENSRDELLRPTDDGSRAFEFRRGGNSLKSCGRRPRAQAVHTRIAQNPYFLAPCCQHPLSSVLETCQ